MGPTNGSNASIKFSSSAQSPQAGGGGVTKKRKLDDNIPRIDQFLARTKKAKATTAFFPKIKSVPVKFSLAKCDRTLSAPRMKEAVEDGIVGSLDTEKGRIWMYTANSEINLLHPLRLKV